MAYRAEKELNGRTAIVIDGWEHGIADSPYTGITSLKNLNISWLTKATYVNYKRKPITLTGSMKIPKFYTKSTDASPTYYILDDAGQVWQSNDPTSTWTILTGNHVDTTGRGLGYGIAYYMNYLFVFGPNYVEVCGNGSGVGGITSANWANVAGSGYYFKNLTARSITPPTAGDDHITLSSSWDYASGDYQIILPTSLQEVRGTFTNGSTNVPIVPVVSTTSAGATADIRLFPAVFPPNHMALVGIKDVLYFTNGNTIGSISTPVASPGTVFKVNDFTTQEVNYGALQLRNTDRAVWLEELNQNLLIAVQGYIYAWDKTTTLVDGFPTQTFTATPINEQPSRMINILNNIYIFAGQKGNIYISNGYSVSLFKKIPDSFIPAIDPSWIIGGMMFHRNKLFFGAVGTSQTNNTSAKVQGIFSLVLSTGVSNSNETAGSINFESQNSYGISPTAAADGTGILIDGNFFYGSGLLSGVNNDTYYSAYFNNGAGGIDFNDGTLWANYEPAIETDLIPVGTFLESRTFENIEYKLDEPLANGDSIRLSYRTNFFTTYTLVGKSEVTGVAGTTTATATAATQVLSDNFNSNVQNAQWVQFLIEFKCAASNSSFIRLREVRIR